MLFIIYLPVFIPYGFRSEFSYKLFVLRIKRKAEYGSFYIVAKFIHPAFVEILKSNQNCSVTRRNRQIR